jgi:hypothetical protein
MAVALSGGKDSLTMLEALLLLAQRAPIEFSVCAFDWTYYDDRPSFRLLEKQPDHGCDLCSRYRPEGWIAYALGQAGHGNRNAVVQRGWTIATMVSIMGFLLRGILRDNFALDLFGYRVLR